ncbi:DUF1772 domain-containing protein [Streptomyces sp. NPDC006365]|uniref:anthrone oxygenase family protein n=1 Tax=Streptomyces sp. NPDC006365 TaxID=3364744 RepID=UPI0036A20539
MTRNNTERRRTAAGGVLVAATVAMGLIAGSFYVFACGVMPGLARSDDRVYVEVMQDINKVIENPVFFLSLVGALPLTGIAAWQLRSSERLRGWVWAALAAYALAFVFTVIVNIPLNDDLVGAGDPARITDPAAVREEFEDPWVAWNLVRAALSTLALGCLARALVLYGRIARPARAHLPSAADSA